MALSSSLPAHMFKHDRREDALETFATLGSAVIVAHLLAVINMNADVYHACAVFVGTAVWTIFANYLNKRSTLRKVDAKTEEAKKEAERVIEIAAPEKVALVKRIAQLEKELEQLKNRKE